MNTIFPEIKTKFGFGCMRLPMNGEEVNITETIRMVDAFLENGFNYFDTAHGYLNGKSETALRECLTSRYPRDRYILTDKLTNFFSKSRRISGLSLPASWRLAAWSILISTSCTPRTRKISPSSRVAVPMRRHWN